MPTLRDWPWKIAQQTPRASSQKQKLLQRHGAVGEYQIAHALHALGFVMIEKVHTPWRVIFGPGGRIVRAFPVEKVCGDFRCMTKTGRSVLVESKSREDGPLSWSDLEKHQHEALRTHDENHGLSLVGWVRPDSVRLFPYQLAIASGWTKGKPMQPEMATIIALVGSPHP